MVPKRVFRSSVNWADLSKRTPDSLKTQYTAFKTKSDDYLRKVLVNPEEPPKIDWSYYKSNAANQALIEQFEKLYQATKIPYPDDQGAYAKVEEEGKKIMADVIEFAKFSKARCEQYKKDIEMIEKAIPIEEMTEEEFALAYPALALQPLTKPTMYPHLDEVQYTKEDMDWFRKKGIYPPGPDRYYP